MQPLKIRSSQIGTNTVPTNKIGRDLLNQLTTAPPLRVETDPLIPDDTRFERYKSMLGTEVQGAVVIYAGLYIDYRGEEQRPPEAMILRTASCRASLKNYIVESSVQGRPGVIKEYMGTGDYEVQIRARIEGAESIILGLAPDRGFAEGTTRYEMLDLIPEDHLSFLSEWAETPTVLAIENEFLNALSITDFVCYEWSWSQLIGRPSTIDVFIYGISERFSDQLIIEEKGA